METESKHPKSPLLSGVLSVTVVLLFICMAGQCYNFFILKNLKAKTPAIETWYNPLREEFFAQLLLCMAVWISAYLIYKRTLKSRIAGILLSIIGTVAFCGFLVQGILMNEYYEEFYLGGYNADFEWKYTHSFMIVNLIFCISAMVFVIRGMRNLKYAVSTDSQSNEYIFEITQYIGIISGVIGLMFTWYAYKYLSFYSHKLSPSYVNWVFMCCLIFMFPYLSMILFWIIRLACKKDRLVYDEKQKSDLAKAGLYTWLFSIPVMSFFMFMNIHQVNIVTGVLAFPVYVFTTLLIFSIFVLLNFKRA